MQSEAHMPTTTIINLVRWFNWQVSLPALRAAPTRIQLRKLNGTRMHPETHATKTKMTTNKFIWLGKACTK